MKATSNQRADTATIEFTESVNTDRLDEAQAFRREQYRQACLDDPEAVAAYEQEVTRRRASRVANQLARTERQA